MTLVRREFEDSYTGERLVHWLDDELGMPHRAHSQVSSPMVEVVADHDPDCWICECSMEVIVVG